MPYRRVSAAKCIRRELDEPYETLLGGKNPEATHHLLATVFAADAARGDAPAAGRGQPVAADRRASHGSRVRRPGRSSTPSRWSRGRTCLTQVRGPAAAGLRSAP